MLAHHFLEFWGAPIFSVLVSGIYFRSSPSSVPLRMRLFASAHGIAIASLYFVAMGIWRSGTSRASYGIPFLCLLTIPLVLIGVSFFCFRGSRLLHLLQIVNLLCLVWTAFIGSMAVTGDWL